MMKNIISFLQIRLTSKEIMSLFFFRECKGFPADSLFRFEMFLSIDEKLKNMDYLFFFNANAVIKEKVANDIIPGEENGFLMCAIHSLESIKKLPVMYFTYERNKKSLAYVAPFKHPKYHYYQGCLNGGRTDEFLSLCRKMANNIRVDYVNNIIACFHDESHLNRYFRDFPPLALGKEYNVPEGYEKKITPKIIFRDKVKVNSSFRKSKSGMVAKFLRVIRKTISGLKWYAGL